MTIEPRWLTVARNYIGVREIKGSQHNPKILEFWKKAKLGGIKNDEIPWCAGFVSGVLEESGIRSARADNARAYLSWGGKLESPVLGCVVVFERGASGGHVGFLAGQDAGGNLMVLGGNQGDMVKISPFSTARVIGYRWPAGQPVPTLKLPLLTGDGKLSTNEV